MQMDLIFELACKTTRAVKCACISAWQAIYVQEICATDIY